MNKLTFRVYNDYVIEQELDPNDFVKCDTIHVLEYEVISKLTRDNPNYKNIIDSKLTLDQEFINKWKQLVEFIPGNVMSLKKKQRIMSYTDTYTKVQAGCELTYAKTSTSLHHISFGDYQNYYFDPKKNYKCWYIDNDNAYYVSTQLLYAEEV